MTKKTISYFNNNLEDIDSCQLHAHLKLSNILSTEDVDNYTNLLLNELATVSSEFYEEFPEYIDLTLEELQTIAKNNAYTIVEKINNTFAGTGNVAVDYKVLADNEDTNLVTRNYAYKYNYLNLPDSYSTNIRFFLPYKLPKELLHPFNPFKISTSATITDYHSVKNNYISGVTISDSYNSQYTYNDIKTIGDHVHWLGDRGPHAGNFRSAAAGGGHAHAGAMIYLGGDSWPKKYRNTIFMNNINGSKLNNDQLTRSGSGYVGSHNQDFLAMNDSWSQWLNFKYDPSGSVFAIDWYDQNQCHSSNPDVHDKTLGRIFKISHDNDRWVQVNLYKASDLELVNYQLHPNEFYVRQARTILQERGANPEVHATLKKILANNVDITRKLRALWTLHVTQGINEKELNHLLSNDNEYLRSWAIQLLTEDKKISPTTLDRFVDLAKNDASAIVRLYLSSALLRLEPATRWRVLEALVQKSEDVADHNLPLMLWYATEPLIPLDVKRALELAGKAKIPNILSYTLQRIDALNTVDSKNLLKKYKEQLTAGDKEENQAHIMLIDNLLSEQ